MGTTVPGRGCWYGPATRRPSVRRCGPGSATPSCAGACAGPRGSGARRCAGGRPPRPSSPAFSRERRDECGGRPGQPEVAARSAELAERLRRHFPGAGRLVIHDLGGGSGAMGRWLAPRLPGPQHWVVHERDAGLLKLAVAEAPGLAADGDAVTVEGRRSDITRLAPGDLAGASLIVASALLDMLTADELVRMLGACIGFGRCPMLLALTFVGRVAVIPTDRLDARMA